MDYKQRAELNKSVLEISFVYSSLLVSQVKTLSGRLWKPAQKFWTCPPSFENIEKLLEFGFKLGPKAEKLWAELNTKPETVDLSDNQLMAGAYPFQVKGVEFLEMMNGRALIGDEMGLGKTVQALLYLKIHPELRPAVIVCPASLKLNWEKECRIWLDKNEWYNVLSGNYSEEKDGGECGSILIINYDILDSWKDCIAGYSPKVLILDEAHYIKNSKAKRTKAVKKLAKKCPHVIGLTGTPIINRPIEFFGILNLISPTDWPSFWGYAHKYCGAKHNGFGWDFNGASKTEELNERSKRTMIRRLKSEVLPDLPAKIRTVVPMEITNRSEYNRMVDELDNSDSVAIQLTRIEALKQKVVGGKIDSCIAWIKDFLESGQKLVIFCTHRKVIDRLMAEFGEMIAVKVDGSVSSINRNTAVEAFQNYPNIQLFIGNIKAAGVGLTLTAASSTCFIELGWTPGDHDQAEDRVHRIGQEADSVNAYYLLGQNTIDMEIAELLDKKRGVLDAVLDGKETDESSLLTELMARLTGEKG